MATPHRGRRSRRRHHGGFTLVELLVVVVILGILSAVVVFAVRGAGDKGDAAAAAADARTIRTAEEAYCAKANQYATMDQLTGKTPAADGNTYRFISEASTSHQVTAIDGKLYPPRGPCNGWRYDLTDTPTGSGPTTTTPGPPANPGAKCPDPEGWCPIAPNAKTINYDTNGNGASNANALVQLPSGKVLTSELDGGFLDYVYGLELYDPTAGPTAAWSSALAPGQPTGEYQAMIPIGGTDCDPRCGDVLIFVYGFDLPGKPGLDSSWQVLNPETGRWLSPPTGRAADPYPWSAQMNLRGVQITGPACESNCGKILVTGIESHLQDPAEYTGERRAQLYDPNLNAFTYVGAPDDVHSQSTLAPLRDGRVLITFATGSPFCDRFYSDCTAPPLAKLFDPATAKFSDAALPNYLHDGRYNSPAVLPDGSVLELEKTFVDGEGGQRAEIYKPDSGGGSWVTVPKCSDDCYILASLADGTVVAMGAAEASNPNGRSVNRGAPSPFGNGPGGLFHGGQPDLRSIFLFDPVRHNWRQTGSLASPLTPGDGVLLTGGDKGPRACGSNCEKILAAGGQRSALFGGPRGPGSAELYTPPTCTNNRSC